MTAIFFTGLDNSCAAAILAQTVRHLVTASPSKNNLTLPVVASITETVVCTTGISLPALLGTTVPNLTIVGPPLDARAI